MFYGDFRDFVFGGRRSQQQYSRVIIVVQSNFNKSRWQINQIDKWFKYSCIKSVSLWFPSNINCTLSSQRFKILTVRDFSSRRVSFLGSFFKRIVCRRTQNLNKSPVNFTSQIEYWIWIRGRTSIVCACCVINRTEFMHRQISSHWARDSKQKSRWTRGQFAKAF